MIRQRQYSKKKLEFFVRRIHETAQKEVSYKELSDEELSEKRKKKKEKNDIRANILLAKGTLELLAKSGIKVDESGKVKLEPQENFPADKIGKIYEAFNNTKTIIYSIDKYISFFKKIRRNTSIGYMAYQNQKDILTDLKRLREQYISQNTLESPKPYIEKLKNLKSSDILDSNDTFLNNFITRSKAAMIGIGSVYVLVASFLLGVIIASLAVLAVTFLPTLVALPIVFGVSIAAGFGGVFAMKKFTGFLNDFHWGAVRIQRFRDKTKERLNNIHEDIKLKENLFTLETKTIPGLLQELSETEHDSTQSLQQGNLDPTRLQPESLTFRRHESGTCESVRAATKVTDSKAIKFKK